jgi:hypothetical protein
MLYAFPQRLCFHKGQKDGNRPSPLRGQCRRFPHCKCRWFGWGFRLSSSRSRCWASACDRRAGIGSCRPSASPPVRRDRSPPPSGCSVARYCDAWTLPPSGRFNLPPRSERLGFANVNGSLMAVERVGPEATRLPHSHGLDAGSPPRSGPESKGSNFLAAPIAGEPSWR